MNEFEPLLNRWESAGVLDEEAAERIRAYENEQERPAGLRWQGMIVLILGPILLACGVVLFVSAHWNQMGPALRFALIAGTVAVFHLAGAFTHESYRGVSTALHTVGTISTGAAIAVVGQIFNIQEHWPAAVLLWALAALAGWALLNDQAQEILALLLLPAWILCEFSFRADNHIGESVYQGRFLIVWAVLYLTLFLGVRRKAVQGVLFGVSAIAATIGIVLVLDGWTSWSSEQTFLPLSIRLWGWATIALLPLFVACFRPLKSFIPVTAALAFSVALPWCTHTWTERFDEFSGAGANTRVAVFTAPNLLAHALVAAFAVFLCWWGIHRVSRALVNLGIVGFAVAVVWFYFSDIYDAVGRSLGLIFLGALFLAGGWLLEKARRGLMAHMERKDALRQEAE